MTTGGWETVRTAVGQRVGEAAFEAWIRTLDGRLEGETLVLRCPDRFTRDWVRSRFGRTIEECAPAARSIEYRVDPGALAPPRPERAEPVAEPAEQSCAQEQLFERFVVGPGSALALEASRAVARGEAGRCKPLFLLGGTGSGKTHLCRAISGQVRPAALYPAGEEFATDGTQDLRPGQRPG